MEVAMKYVLLGNLSPEWASKQSERIGKAKAKLDKLGIKIESIHYTQGYYDFVDIVDAPNQEAMLAFSIWYATQGLGRIQSMPAFDAKSFETAIKAAAGWSPPSGSFDLGSVAPSRCVLASDQPGRMLAFMLIRGHLAQCQAAAPGAAQTAH
jgi:uncharacterized protein with GYD domain